MEVDFVLDGRIAIEVKATKKVSGKHLIGLNALREENICTDYILVCDEDRPRLEGKIEVLPWKIFLEQLWSGRFSRKKK
jgi:predicted AAA+ superfamily ATPase